jgi:hypothetical protein
MRRIFYCGYILAFSAVNTYANPPINTQTEISCQMHIPATAVTLQPAVVKPWAEMATMRSFTFSADPIEKQLTTLKDCFTDQGWKSFEEAFQKSGNLQTIKKHQLKSTAQITGTTQIEAIKNNLWSVTMPVQVIYANDQQNVTQNLSIKIIVGRKPTGDLGINQIIATQVEIK